MMFLRDLATKSILVLISLWLLRILIQIVLKLTSGKCKCNTCLNGKTALITGGNSGLGYETALALAGRGCRVIIADKDNCDESKKKIIEETGNTNIVTKYFDLTSLTSVRKLAKEINETEERLDILINNAGIGGGPNVYTEDELHTTMQINHFGPFLLTHLLIGLLKKSAPSRIIFVSSWLAFTNNLSVENLNYPKHESPTYLSTLCIYGNSKLCNVITAKELSKKLHGTGVIANSLHPGLVYTPIFQKCNNAISVDSFSAWLSDKLFLKPYAKTVKEGAQTAIHLALTNEIVTGKYFSDCKVFMEPRKANDPAFVEQIWKASEEYVKLSEEERL